MINKKMDNIVVFGTIVLVISSITSAYIPFTRYIFISAVLFVILYMFVHADYFSFHKKGSVKWSTYRYLSLFGLCCALAMYCYSNFIVREPSSIVRYNLFLPVLMAVFGNLAPRIAYNKTLGLRLPWTLQSEACWRYAHRMIGYVTIPCLLLIMFAFVSKMDWLYVIALLSWIMIPSISSYHYAKKKGDYVYMKNIMDLHRIEKLACIVMIITTLLLFPMLPDNLPMQFGSDGGVNWSLPKIIGVCIIPLLTLFMITYRNDQQQSYRVAYIACGMCILNLGFLSYIAFFM